ncbi:hypothetical protein CQW23_01296 [Capsicum baccatum]|uniref:Post-SET domain-containing protein n=1 Tax=Capsicum baccatum TaxID=33114 RepID=A0A2G2XN62_CAPBA|nr:hypothetical protein CQW23_01296 [Capsicum baccatum]
MHSERFVEFGADENCHYGAEECKRKLGIKPNKLKRSFLNAISSDAALKLVASQVAAASTKEKAPVYAKHVCTSNLLIDSRLRPSVLSTTSFCSFLKFVRGRHKEDNYALFRKGALISHIYSIFILGGRSRKIGDEDCHCGAVECKRKLGIKPNKLKRPFSGATTLDAASKLVESLVIAVSTEEKALVSGKHGKTQRGQLLSKSSASIPFSSLSRKGALISHVYSILIQGRRSRKTGALSSFLEVIYWAATYGPFHLFKVSFHGKAAELSTVGPAHLGKGKEALLLDSNLAVFICTKLNKPAILVRQRANAHSERFVQFGADEDCHSGVEECKGKLKIKPNILKRSFSDAASSDAALKLATSRVVAASIEEKVYLQNMCVPLLSL